MRRVRPAILAGSWYPSAPEKLRAAVRGYLGEARATQRPAGKPLVVVAPHAGYVYSGSIAGRLYGLLRDFSYERVFILAPSHRAVIDAVTLSEAEAFSTPLGLVEIDTAIVMSLARRPGFQCDDSAHAAEHAVEIQLPFLQEVFGKRLRIVPMLVPPLATESRRLAAAALARWCDGDSLFMVSSDFTHYGANYGYIPFDEDIPERLTQLDQGAIDRILARDSAGLLSYGQQTGISMCGIHAAALAVALPLPTAGSALQIAYARSGDRDRDYSLSVSYAALMICADPTDAPDRPSAASGVPEECPRPARGAAEDDPAGPAQGGFDTRERRFLVELARRVVLAAARGDRGPEPAAVAADLDFRLTPRLSEHRGVFVTLLKKGELRGCIGYIEGSKPLSEAVVDNARAAACRDPRFAPVHEDELADLELEISVLSPLYDVPGPEDIVLGKHGIVMCKGGARSVFLPQVPTEQGWDLETTLMNLALKAGLSADAWREDTSWRLFQVPLKLWLGNLLETPTHID